MVAPDGEPFHAVERVDGERGHGFGVLEHALHAQLLHVLDGARPADCLRDRRRSHLVLDSPLAQIVGIDGRMRDCAAADGYGVHLVERVFPDEQAADAEGPVHLVGGESGEVAAEFLHVEGQMGERLRGVEHEAGAGLMCQARHVGHGIHDAEHVRHVGDAYEFGVLAKESLVFPKVKPAVGKQGNEVEHGIPAARQKEPRQKVGVVFGKRDDDVIAFIHVEVAPRVRHQIA